VSLRLYCSWHIAQAPETCGGQVDTGLCTAFSKFAKATRKRAPSGGLSVNSWQRLKQYIVALESGHSIRRRAASRNFFGDVTFGRNDPLGCFQVIDV
jgi:hypothetical protein